MIHYDVIRHGVIHHDALILSLAAVLLCAYVAGSICARFKQPLLVGFVLTGILLGPSGLGVIASHQQVESVAELGVLLLLFLIGTRIPLDTFRNIWRKSLLICALQLLFGIVVVAAAALFVGGDLAAVFVIGAAMALSSTATVTRLIKNLRLQVHSLGKLTIGVLIAQDIAFIPIILLVGAAASGGEALWRFAIALAGFAALFLLMGKKINLPLSKLAEKNKEILLLQGAALCIGAAALAEFFGLSPAYGALLGGMLVANSNQAEAMHEVMSPLEKILVMVFFVSIGLLINLDYLGEHIALIIGLAALVLLIKTVGNVLIFRLSGEPWTHAFISSILIAQIGELSFLIWRAGGEASLVTPTQESALVAVAAVSLLATPLWLMAGQRLLRFILTKS